MAGVKKKAQRQGRLIVFVDESGLSTQPTRVRTWAPRGQTPVLQETFNWKSLSIIGGMVLWHFFFQVYSGSIKGAQVIEFLKHLQRHVPGKLLILWDGASIHRSKLVRDYIAGTHGCVEVERLPACERRSKSAAGVTGVTGLVTECCGTFNNNEGCTQIWKTGVRYAGGC